MSLFASLPQLPSATIISQMVWNQTTIINTMMGNFGILMSRFEALNQIVSEQQFEINFLYHEISLSYHRDKRCLDFIDTINHTVDFHRYLHEEQKTDSSSTTTNDIEPKKSSKKQPSIPHQTLPLCNTTKNCEFLQQLQAQMQQYNNDDDAINYNIESVLNNFEHLMQMHNNVDHHDLSGDFEYIYYALGGFCDITTCERFKRHQMYRDRDSSSNVQRLKDIYNVDDDTEVTRKQIMDKIHCFYRHCYDIGNRLTPDKLVQVMLSKTAFQKHQKLCGKSACYPERHKKFTLFGEVCDDMKLPTATRTQEMFSLGYKFRYYDSGDGYSVHRKYESLKEELISNDIMRLTTEQFNNELRKSKLHLHSFFCKHWMKTYHAKCCQSKMEDMRSLLDAYNKDKEAFWKEKDYTPRTDQILEVLRDDPGMKKLQLHHILALMVYCNFTDLQFEFSLTYRKKTLNEPDESVVNRHSIFYHFGKYLKEAVQWFGAVVDEENEGPSLFYHGINDTFIFPQVVDVDVQCPLSTTTKFSVATHFATESGIVVTLKPRSKKAKYMPVFWLSDYGNESEHLFVQSGAHFNIENIILIEDGIELWSIFRCIRHLEKIVKLEKTKDVVTRQDQKVLAALINNELCRQSVYAALLAAPAGANSERKYNKDAELHEYGGTLFHQYCVNKKKKKFIFTKKTWIQIWLS
eukprot:30279_1